LGLSRRGTGIRERLPPWWYAMPMVSVMICVPSPPPSSLTWADADRPAGLPAAITGSFWLPAAVGVASAIALTSGARRTIFGRGLHRHIHQHSAPSTAPPPNHMPSPLLPWTTAKVITSGRHNAQPPIAATASPTRTVSSSHGRSRGDYVRIRPAHSTKRGRPI
jgi:hypothetical protein